MKLRSKLLATLSMAAIAATSAEATPAFARQMNMDCMSCHTQQLPMLNSFGREFKLSSFSMTSGDQANINDMSLARALNAGFGFKGVIQNSQKEVASAPAETAGIPSGASLLLGGRIAENMGTNILISNNGTVHLQASMSTETLGGRLGVVGFGTGGHGAFIGTESHNTGLHKEIGMFANADLTNAAQATGIGKGMAQGLTAYYGGHGVTASAGVWSQGYNAIFTDGVMPSIEGGMNVNYRVTYDLPTMSGWDVAVGLYGTSGTTRGDTAKLYEDSTTISGSFPGVQDVALDSTGFDVQVIGAITENISLQVIGQFVSGYEMSFTDVNNTTKTAKNQSATSTEAQIMWKNKVGLRLAYLKVDDKVTTKPNDYSATTIGVQYNVRSNIHFALEYSTIDNTLAANPKGVAYEKSRLGLSSIIVF